MTKIKSYTDLEQSKKLAEILPIESADMYWYIAIKGNPKAMLNEGYNKYGDFELPCWSLAALLSFIPCSYEVYRHPYDDRLSLSLKISNCIEVIADNEIDACYKMIMRLKELKIL